MGRNAKTGNTNSQDPARRSTSFEQRASVLPANLQNAGDPVDGNPFAAGDPEHAVWQKATLTAEEESCRINVQFMNDRPMRQFRLPDGATQINFCVAKFDVWAKRAINVVWSKAALAAYDEWLFKYAQSWLDEQTKAGRPEILPVLRSRLIERLEWWKAEARRYLAEIVKQVESSRAQNSGKTAQIAESKPAAQLAPNSASPKKRGPKANTDFHNAGRGEFCDQVINDMKRIKNLVRTGWSIAEVEQDYPDLATWKVRAQLGSEDQETFNHPGQWGPVVGYTKMLLSKTHGVSPHAIDSWRKAYRKGQKTKKA